MSSPYCYRKAERILAFIFRRCLRPIGPSNFHLPPGFLAAKLGTFRKELMGYTDKRVGLMSEIINGIQMIKFYAWEGESLGGP